MELQKKLAKIQSELKAPKGQWNDFSKYHYRNAEDILEAVKPLLGDCVLTVSDKVKNIGDRYYIQATAKLSCGTESFKTIAYAREEETKKGMDGSQITGSASSYARKYALNGLFCIDDTKDADSNDNKDTSTKKVSRDYATTNTNATNAKTQEANACEHKNTEKRVTGTGVNKGKVYEKCTDCGAWLRFTGEVKKEENKEETVTPDQIPF